MTEPDAITAARDLLRAYYQGLSIDQQMDALADALEHVSEVNTSPERVRKEAENEHVEPIDLEAAYLMGRRDGIEAERAKKRQPVSVNLYERAG